MENGTNKREKFYQMLGILVIYIALYSVIILSVEYFYYEKLNISFLESFINENFGPLFLILHDVIALPIYFIIIYFMHKKSLFQISQFVKIKKKTAALCLLLGVSMGTWVMSITQIPYIKDSFPIFQTLFKFLLSGNAILVIFFVALHAIYKEIFFRGMIFNQLRSVLWLPLAIVINGLIYGYLFFQWDIILTIYGMLGAIIFNLVFIWYESIWATIAIEFSLFATYFILREMNYEYGWTSITLIFVSSIVLIGTMVALWKQRQSTSTRQIETEAATPST
ncbi:CPBP family intramembrane glutamic endopeptidase [Chengkuizengella sediminis]|uniref:CPBP family intramembrane glutamic endopeptidase n=1 Tax=Chengkuizengella sediminis TaxID=1885917 RepID=UPI001389DBE3|nr:CPBP family intramembrane glutamic endopeptidase [Chengkuizengella sediminis]NDI36674.1 CPBP family intramembrane metalloprotease [Chengkuizengella sediminis]